MPHVLAWDIETVPDLRGYAAANGLEGKTDDEIRDEMGDRFPKHICHSIACIGALIARHDGDHWVVDALGAPHVGEFKGPYSSPRPNSINGANQSF